MRWAVHGFESHDEPEKNLAIIRGKREEVRWGEGEGEVSGVNGVWGEEQGGYINAHAHDQEAYKKNFVLTSSSERNKTPTKRQVHATTQL